MTKERPPKKEALRIGHRGACGHAPENTLRSIAQAVALGCDLIEVDVQRTKDGHLVLIHDARVDRTTNGKGLVAEMNLEDLRKFDAGGGQKIPTAWLMTSAASSVRAASRAQFSMRRSSTTNCSTSAGPTRRPASWFC